MPEHNKYRKYNFFVQRYNAAQKINIVPNCNSITVTNVGDNIAIFDAPDSMILYPGTPGTSLGDSRTIGGNEGEVLDRKQINLGFTTVSAGQLVEVIQKYYV